MYYIKPVLEEDELKSNGYCTLEFIPNSNVICMKKYCPRRDIFTIFICIKQ